MPRLLSIAEARELVRAAVSPLGDEVVPVADALDRVLAEDVSAVSDVPGFANSAMDGFAVRSGPAARTLRIVGESRAGAPASVAVGQGEAIRISTGAALPDGADAVLQVELVDADEAAVTLRDDVAPGRNVRRAGEDLRAGALVLQRGARLGPAELGVAVAAGRGTLRVGRRPRVTVVAPGDELVAPGEPLGRGQIHDSNAVTLGALARRAGAQVRIAGRAPDDREGTRAALGAALEDADVLVITGGVSVGPHDHVKPALSELGVEERFWRVALRPGKPTWFGTREGKLVFGLPGNPVSAMVTFHLFARAALVAQQGAPFASGARGRARLAHDLPRTAERDEAVRVRLEVAEDGVLEAASTGAQDSHLLTSMAGADALTIVTAGAGAVPAGTVVDVERL
jgi:molybdopterin molybdotransferase